MKKLLTGVLAALLCVGTLAGCSSNSDTNKGKEKVINIAAEKGGNLDTKFDYVWVNNGELYKELTFRHLFMADPTLSDVTPDLAESYKLSDDGLTLTIKMKDNLKWSDGEALTAEDVKWSMSTILKAALANGIYTSAFSKIEGAEDWKAGKADSLKGISVDENTVTIKFDQKVGNIMNVLAQFVILPKHCLEKADPLQLHNDPYWEKPVTDGMYKIGDFQPGNYIELVRDENYEGEKPKIDKVIVNIVGDALTAAQSGKSDFMKSNAPGMIEELKKIDGYKAFSVDTLFYRYFIVNYEDANGKKNEKMADYRVREAIMYAINRKELVNKLYPDLGVVSNAGVPEGYDGYDQALNQFEYNPEKAKQLLKEAGWDFNEPLKIIYYYGDQTSIDFINAVTQYLTEVGMKVDAVKITGDSTTALFSVKNYDIALKGLSAFGFEEYYGEYLSSNANCKNIFGTEGHYDDLYNQLVAETDKTKRADILKELQAQEQKDLYKLPMYTLKNEIFVNTNHIILPDGIKFGNPWYSYDKQFAKWDVK